MKKIAFAVIMSAVTILFGCSKSNTNVNNKNQNAAPQNASMSQTTELNSADQTAPDFTLTDTKGKKISLSDYKGKVVILDFWATWCPPCRRGIPDLISIKKEYKNKIVIIGVSLDVDTKKNVVPFMKSYGINYPVVYATNQVVKDYGNIDAIPTSFIIDKDGKIVNQHIGLTPKEVYVDEINKLLGNS